METTQQSFETLIYEKRDGIGCVTLNRPDVLNIYNTRMRDDLYEVLNAIHDDDELRVIIFRGAGQKAFCAGADLSEFLSAPSPVMARQVRFERDVWKLFLSIDIPLIAAVHGFVLGSGIEIALCCDIRIASEDARFGLPEVALGIIPAAGGTQTVPRTIGIAGAMDMLLANRWLTAREALNLGLVNKVVPAERLMNEAQAMAGEIASFNPQTIQKAKQALNRGLELSLAEGLALETRLAQSLRQ